MDIAEHALALPFGFPDDVDARVARHLADDDWASALTLLRDHVTLAATNPRWLLLLAYARFRDASEVMVDELADGAREALTLIDRAMELGIAYDVVAPLRDAVEAALDQVSREELALTERCAAGADLSTLDLETLEAAAFLFWRTDRLRAAQLFVTCAQRAPAGARVYLARAALCRAELGMTPEVHQELELAFAADWSTFRNDRVVLESVATQLLLRERGASFDALWAVAEARAKSVDLPFPSVWPNQERLLAHCVEHGLRQGRVLAERIGATRPEVSKALDALMRRAFESTH